MTQTYAPSAPPCAAEGEGSRTSATSAVAIHGQGRRRVVGDVEPERRADAVLLVFGEKMRWAM